MSYKGIIFLVRSETMNERAVLYLRLSKEDADKLNKGDDSRSIKNQRLLLTNYALEKNFKIVKVYSDDDESGLYDDRPGFEEMMEDAKLGIFDVIIAKKQSRFSRNMEHIEKYLHHDLPNLGVRFIGVVDGVDTADTANKKSRQINGLVNEWYCEDLSENIRSSFRAKMKNGQYLGSSCPYGYIKDPDNHNHLIVDAYAAGVVRRIFKLYLEGYGKAKIGAILTEDGILIPTLYKQQVLGINYKNSKAMATTKTWSYQTIHTILNNQMYIGDLVQNKVNKISYKDKKKKNLPREAWIIVPNMHEPIISRETFDRVQELQKIKTKSVNSTTNKDNGLFSGIIFCADCKHAMGRKYARHGDHQFVGYVCKIYKQHGKKFCSSHSIDHADLEEAVLTSIQEEAHKILTPKDISDIDKIQIENSYKAQYRDRIRQLQSEMDKIESYKRKTYDNLLEEIIGKQEYIKYIKEYDSKINDLEKQLQEVSEKMELQNEVDEQYDAWISTFKNYMNVTKLTRGMILELIDKIEVHEDGVIDIYYRFCNPFEQ